MPKKNIAVDFKSTQLNERVKLIEYKGNHWDNISYFPKDYEFGLIKAGAGTFIIQEENLEVTAGNAFLIHPNLIHSGKPNETLGWEVISLKINPSLVKEITTALFNADFDLHFPSILINDAEAELKLAHILNEISKLTEADKTNTLITESDLYYLVQELIELTAKSSFIHKKIKKQHWALAQAKTYIETHYESNISLDELASEVFLSKFHFLRTFKSEFGMGPHEYQLQLKLNKARTLIFEEQSLTEVAHKLGFADQAHFINTYKKHAGITPSEFLKTAIFYNSSKK